MKRFRETPDAIDFNLAQVLMLLSQQQQHHHTADSAAGDAEPDAAGRVFECKTCNRQFPSFQALGGHRASHKKPRLVVDADGHVVPLQNSHGTKPAAKPRSHECSICGVEFALGQALGGHMRRHRAALSAAGTSLGAAGEEVNNHLMIDRLHKSHDALDEQHQEIVFNPPPPAEVSKTKTIAYYGGTSSARVQLANALDLNVAPQPEATNHHHIVNDPLELTLRCTVALDLLPSLVH